MQQKQILNMELRPGGALGAFGTAHRQPQAAGCTLVQAAASRVGGGCLKSLVCACLVGCKLGRLLV